MVNNMKNTILRKKILVVFMIVLFGIKSFAAAVSDNDGAAFITKAEFDSLKSNFQHLLNEYNNNIDNKIDNAVASYIAGVRVSKEPSVLYGSVKSSLGSNLRFLNNFATEWTVGTSTDTPMVSNVFQRSYRYKKSIIKTEWNQCLLFQKGKPSSVMTIYANASDKAYCVPLSTLDLSTYNINGASWYSSSYSGDYWCLQSIAYHPSLKSYLDTKYCWMAMNQLERPTGTGTDPYPSSNQDIFKSNIATGAIRHLSFGWISKNGVKKDNYSYYTWLKSIQLTTDGEMRIVVSTDERVSSLQVTKDLAAYENNAYAIGAWWWGSGNTSGSTHKYYGNSDEWNSYKLYDYNSTSKPFALLKLVYANSTWKYIALYFKNTVTAGANKYYEIWGEWIKDLPAAFKSDSYVSQVGSVVKSQTASGSGWRYRNLPNGNKAITTYDTSLYPSMTLNLKYHSYADKSSVAASSGSFSDTTARSQTLNNTATIGITSGGTDHGPSSTSTGGYWQQILSLTDVASPVVFETAQWGDDLSGNLYMAPEKGYTFARNGTMSTDLTNGPSLSWSDEGFDHTATAATNTAYTMKLNRESLAKTSFENSYLSAVAGETVYVGGGCPIVQLESEDKITVTMDFLAKSKADAGTLVNGAVINYKISDKQFTAGNFSSGARNIASGTVTTNSSGTAQVTFDTEALPKGTKLWISAYASTKPQVVELTNVTARLKTS